jgi:hypothetical protein
VCSRWLGLDFDVMLAVEVVEVVEVLGELDASRVLLVVDRVL